MPRQTGLPPIYDAAAEVLILGSFPSEKSRTQKSYYSNPSNCFWKLICEYFQEPLPTSDSQKEALLLTHHIAVWDMIESCEIVGSSNKDIKNCAYHRAAEIQALIDRSDIKTIVLNGKKLARAYKKQFGALAVHCEPVMSTSAANNGRAPERKEEWRNVLDSCISNAGAPPHRT